MRIPNKKIVASAFVSFVVATSAANAADDPRPYEKALEQLLPMSADQIVDFRSEVDIRQEAARHDEPISHAGQTIRVSTDPGEVPPTITMAPHYAGAVTILDAKGNAWPINTVTVGSSDAFEVIKPAEDDKKTSILIITPQMEYANTNMIMTLEGLSTPIIMRLNTNPDFNKDRTDVIVEGYAPNTASNKSTTSMVATQPDDEVMRYLIDDIPPKNARSVEISGGSAKGWFIGDSFYLRTKLKVQSPAWLRMVKGGGGVAVYEMPLAPSISAANSNGRDIVLKVQSGALLDFALNRAKTGYEPKTVKGSSNSFGRSTSTIKYEEMIKEGAR